ncbi:MAG TPA: TRCF domain-containing protein, partial [Solirubrobacteraceae bacterium]|nr:TRCF domain-containing protein [Solirubrobacteraceae bacterium]
GRSRERAYAYLLYDSAAALTPEAAQRLSALSDYTELGAGFKIAMRDLEIRGAGNLLGDEQSGHVAALGFELYMQMLDEAVRAAEPEGEGEALPEPVRLDVNVDAYVPADYIPYEQAKIEVHRRVAGALEVADVERLREELPDALYESGRSQVSVRVPKDGTGRFPSVVRAADALLAVMREAA